MPLELPSIGRDGAGLSEDLTLLGGFRTLFSLKSLLQTGSSGRVPVPLKSDFLSIHEGGFALFVAAEQTDSFPVADFERNAIQQQRPPESEGHFLERDQWHKGESLPYGVGIDNGGFSRP